MKEEDMSRFLIASRYLVIVPILGLVIAASFFFILGGYGLIKLLFDLFVGALDLAGQESAPIERGLIIFEVVEFVHTFLVGTVLFITAIGLYQLFIKEIDFPDWLKIDSIEELEVNLIGVTVVVLAVNFMGAVFIGGRENFLEFGAGIGLVIAALALFVGLRSWSSKMNKETESIRKDSHQKLENQTVSGEKQNNTGE